MPEEGAVIVSDDPILAGRRDLSPKMPLSKKTKYVQSIKQPGEIPAFLLVFRRKKLTFETS